jgi:hypothetical protein
MNASIGFFEEVAQVGDHVLDLLGGEPPSRAVTTYLKHVADIYRLLVAIHDEVSDVTVKASVADNLHDAQQALRSIDHQALEETFRVRRWCDELERLGQALQPLGQEAKLAGNEQQTWNEFCVALERREGEVAWLYDSKLYDIRRLADKNLPFDALKSEVKEVSRQLIMQKAEFDLLAKQAEAMLRRLG